MLLLICQWSFRYLVNVVVRRKMVVHLIFIKVLVSAWTGSFNSWIIIMQILVNWNIYNFWLIHNKDHGFEACFKTFKVFRVFEGFPRIWEANPISKLHARPVCFIAHSKVFTLIKDKNQNNISKRLKNPFTFFVLKNQSKNVALCNIIILV